MAAAQSQPVALEQSLSTPFHFVAYADIRFTPPSNKDASNPEIRKILVQAVADTNPAFISINGDIPYRGANPEDWKVFDAETEIWRERKIPVYPALGNHEVAGDEKAGLANYFARFRELKSSRYYSVRAANTEILALDSNMPETSGAQGDWLRHELDTVPSGVDFVFITLHHPPFTGSADNAPGGGHSARHAEQALAELLEGKQKALHAKIVVFAGHVHNYERSEHGGIMYFVSGGGGAHPYLIEHAPGDLFTGKGVNYHYLLVEVDKGKLKVTMNRVEIAGGKPIWTQPDSVTISTGETAKKD